jgi:predicted transcriptional regulator
MARLLFPPRINATVQQKLQSSPGLKDAFNSLVKSIEDNPFQSSFETFVLNNETKISCYKKTARVSSFSKSMAFSKDEITILYIITDTSIQAIKVFFP